MTNEELKKKIVDILQLKLQECPLQPHGIMYRDAAEYIADALISAGIGDIKTAREIGASATAMAVFEAAKAEHSALVAERALLIAAREIMKARGYADSEIEYLAKEVYIPEVMKQAEKELSEERK